VQAVAGAGVVRRRDHDPGELAALELGERVGRVDGEQERVAAREVDLEGLVAGRVAGRAPAAKDAVAEDVPAVLEVLQEHPRHAGLDEVGLHVGHLVVRVGPVRPLVLRARDEHLRVREAVDLRDGARVVEVKVALHDPAHVGRVDPRAAQARDRGLLGLHLRDRQLVDLAPVPRDVDRDLGGVAAVDDDGPARVREREPDDRPRRRVDAGRRVARADLAAAEHVQPHVLDHREPPAGLDRARARNAG
jgi:hypothetical protein